MATIDDTVVADIAAGCVDISDVHRVAALVPPAVRAPTHPHLPTATRPPTPLARASRQNYL